MQIQDTSPKPGNRANQAIAVAVALIVLLAGVAGWWVGKERNAAAQVSTEGPIDASIDADTKAKNGTAEKDSTDSGASDDGTGASTDDGTADDTDAAPTSVEPGAALTFSDVSDGDAPGGYNVWQNGRSNGLYYVLSTAPGVTWESQQAACDDECYLDLRNDTLYTFDGDSWNRSNLGDRFVNSIDSTDSGLLYTVSTGTTTGTQLELGTSEDTGSSWIWTEIDVSGQPGADDGYNRILTAERDGEFMVIVQNPATVDWAEAAALARSAGLDVTDEDLWQVDSIGLEYVERATATDDGPDCSALDIAFHQENDPYADPPFSDVEGQLTEAQRNELDAWYESQQAVYNEVDLASANYINGIEGCEEFAACSFTDIELRSQILADEDAFWADLGLEPGYIDWMAMTDEEREEFDRQYNVLWDPYYTWLQESGCEATFGYGGDGEYQETQYATWAELGVSVPDSWGDSIHAYRVANGQATVLGSIGNDITGWLVSLTATADGWQLIVDQGTHDSNLTTLGSADGAAWTIEATNGEWPDQGFWSGQTDPDGNSWHIDWREDSTTNRLVRTSPNGAEQLLLLDDLIGDADLGMDTSNFQFENVRTGKYGTVVWATLWNFEGTYEVDSVVFFSSDGVQWGATALPGQYVVDAIVGDNDVLIFGENPQLVNTDTPQPVLVGTAG